MIEDLALNEILSQGPDISPIENVDAEGVNAISPIMYSSEYSTAMSYLRALMAVKEYSNRSLTLTAHVISLNPAHYTVWTFRADCLFQMQSDLKDELRYIEDMAEESSKNYQLWHHREIILQRHGQLPDNETLFLNKMLAEDSKNYHVWCYRQWLCKTFDVDLNAELEDTEKLIEEDVYNNSAWNHRFFILYEHPKAHPAIYNMKTNDIDFAKSIITKASDNQSSWSYLKGICAKNGLNPSALLDFAKTFDSNAALAFQAMIYETRQTTENYRLAKQCFDSLKVQDPIRQKYWEYRASNVPQTV